MRKALAFSLLLICLQSAVAQHRVDARNWGERILCIVPMVGAGTPKDPKRPLFAPLPGQDTRGASGIVSWSFTPSDDGRFALVELVASDRAAFKEILENRRTDVKIFEKGKAMREEIEQEFRRYRANFDADKFGEGRR